MTSWTLARRSLRFYLRSHLGTVLGAAIATAVLTGALLVGDSVRESLRQMALSRLGKIDHALISGDRLFKEDLAQRLESNLDGANSVAVLQLPGTAANQDGSSRANNVQINGVGDEFWELANEPLLDPEAISGAWVNTRLAAHLGAGQGDTILVRVPTVSTLSRDAPLSPEEDSTAALRVEVTRILSDDEFGRFGMQASQVAPFNVFLPRETLQQRANAAGQANLLLVSMASSSETAAQQVLREVFTSEDAQLEWRLGTNYIELRTPRVFLDDNIAQAAVTTNSMPVFTYFVNSLQKGGQTTPYSMVTATTAPIVPEDLGENEILINQWLAEDLSAGVGDEITLTYYVMGLMRELIEQTNTFRVRQVVPMEMPFADPTLMPDFPGMTDAENCRDWDTGFPIDTEAIRDQDEAYWDQYRGTPKAFISLAAGQAMWSNRFGSLTAVRYPIPGVEPQAALEARKQWFEENHLAPDELGFVFQPVRAQALAASAGAQDFGGLFIGFSFFLIAAALMLMALLFRFALEQRGVEMGTLLAIGFQPRTVRRLLTLEALGLAVIGGLIGTAGAVLYAQAMVHGLTTIWRDAVGSSALDYHSSPVTLAIGFLSGVFVAALTMWWSLRKEGKRPARELLSEGMESESFGTGEIVAARKRFRRNLIFGSVALLIALVLVGVSFSMQGPGRSQLFFGAGAFLLIAGLAFTSALIRRLEISSFAQRLSLAGMGLRSITRRSTRSRATIMLLACGAFLIASIGAFRLDANIDAERRSSGTGGFALLGRSAIPVVHNLNAQAGRDFFGLDERDLESVSFVPFRVLEGEDASCLNLNLAQRPQLLGVNPDLLARRGAFTFKNLIRDSESPWQLLEQDFGEDVVPAIGDAASIQWALKKNIGDDLLYVDHNGREFKVRIVGAVANSILQGNLVISEASFVRRFPGESGYRMFLIDAPSNRAEEVAATLSRAMQDVGLEMVSTKERLAEFNAVQNTYLGTFQLLGGLGLLLGSFGLGIVLLRNVFERRSELALLLAVGFRKSALRWLVLSEHTALLVMGLAVGLLAAIIAVLPALLEPGAQLPYAYLALTLGAVFFCGLLFTLAAASVALRAPLLNALRNE